MVNSANTECLLFGALARGHFVPIAAVRGCSPIMSFSTEQGRQSRRGSAGCSQSFATWTRPNHTIK